MKNMKVSFLTNTPMHIGCGSSVGVVDMPVLRERVTGFPIIPGSALKGVLADLYIEKQADTWVRTSEGTRLLGSADTKTATAGKLLVGEGQLVAFPVRSAKSGFVWITCPLILNRLGLEFNQTLGDEEGLGSTKCRFDDMNAFVLEEYRINSKGDVPPAIVEALLPLSDAKLWQDSLKDRLVILSDTLMTYFAQTACEIANHNCIDDETGVVKDGALFSQENVPSEALFLATFRALETTDLTAIKEQLEKAGNVLQIGANATTGLGWCKVSCQEVEA